MYKDIIKICQYHGEQPFKVWLYKKYIYKRCRVCLSEKTARYKAKIKADPNYIKRKKEIDRKYWLKNKERIAEKRKNPKEREKRRAYTRAHQHRYREYYKKKQKFYRENLSDSYMKKLLVDKTNGLKFVDIPPELIKAKRSVYILKKKIKEVEEKIRGK